MSGNRVKNAAQWFYKTLFRDEPIRPRKQPPEEVLPSLIRTARSLENTPGKQWQSRESVFLKQGKLLAKYEDKYVFQGSVVRYFPTYASLTDQELRGYFSWRTKLRQGDVKKTSLSFAFLYIYELLNQIGVESPMEGYKKLLAFRDSYGALDDGILSYLEEWIQDYVVYYGLSPDLLSGAPIVQYHHSLTVLDHIQERNDTQVMDAVKQLAPKWISRSKFYSLYCADCDRVIVQSLRRISLHYATKTQKTMVEQLFGKSGEFPAYLFYAAVFCAPKKQRDREVAINERYVYRCRNGEWTLTRHLVSPEKLENILKTIDAVMREEFGYKHPVKYGTETKWMVKVIREEAQALLAEKKTAEAKKLSIDYSQLARIRQEAAVTQEKLTVEEEADIPDELPQEAVTVMDAPQAVPEVPSELPLTEPEYRLLHCLLYGESIGWIQSEGYLLSVLADGINEKLYDTFLDSVLDDSPSLIDDYIEDLKEMIPA